jgi:hypothetical protein
LSPSSQPFYQIYRDVQPVNTTRQLEAVRSLNLSTYYYAYERQVSSNGKSRLRYGAIGADLAKIIPEAVELVPKRVLPPLEKGGDPIVLHNVPVVDENTIFMYGIGATKEVINVIEQLKNEISNMVDRVTHLYGENAKLEHLISNTSSEEAELRMRIAVAEAETLRSEMELEIQMAKDEETFIKAQQEAELQLIQRNAKMTSERLQKEDEVARIRSIEDLKIKFESNRRLEAARSNAATMLSNIEYERELALHKAAQDLKAESAKVCTVAPFQMCIFCSLTISQHAKQTTNYAP